MICQKEKIGRESEEEETRPFNYEDKISQSLKKKSKRASQNPTQE